MKEYSFKDVGNQKGATFLIYGKPGVGKTFSLGTLPEPIHIIVTEPRDPRVSLLPFKNKDMTFAEVGDFDDAIAYLAKLNSGADEGKLRYKSIAFDSLSFIQSRIKLDMEDARFAAGVKKERREDLLVDRFRIEVGDWGGISSAMKRITYLLNQLSKYGIVVVVTATLSEFPSWNKELVAAPSFLGREFPAVINGYFDFIGLVEEGPTEPYPPVISFISKDGSFMAKSCSIGLNKTGGRGTLDFEKILKVISV